MEKNEDEKENNTDKRVLGSRLIRKSIQKVKQIVKLKKKYDGNETNQEGYTTDTEDTEKYPSSEKRKVKSRQKLHENRYKRCLKKRWTCGEDTLWRIYMKSYNEKQKQLEENDDSGKRKPAKLPKFPYGTTFSAYKNVLPGLFQEGQKKITTSCLDPCGKIRLFQHLRDTCTTRTIIGNENIESESIWPCEAACIERDSSRDKQTNSGRLKSSKFPCDEEEIQDSYGTDYGQNKELGHARIPQTCPDAKFDLMVDRDVGERTGLVDGDYIKFVLPSKTRGNRVYTGVCLRGLKGMHLVELGPLRIRKNTWKFCFYQAVVALLAKTQFRYKHVRSTNIDYIYDHAWLLFTHIGTINIKTKQRLDDVVVYNYKYSVELELIDEMIDVKLNLNKITWNYVETNLRKMNIVERKELMETTMEIGTIKVTDQQKNPVNKCTEKIEKWFDRLKPSYRNCIFRTDKFSLAFWQDGIFWYLYNPYRCDEFGFWNDEGYACIVKFCTRDSLKRHLMILLLRAYVYEYPVSEDIQNQQARNNEDTKKKRKRTKEKHPLTIQIFQMIYHCCTLHNLKLMGKRSTNRSTIDESMEKRMISEICPDGVSDFSTSGDLEEGIDEEYKNRIEKTTWLKLYKITWTRCSNTTTNKKTAKEADEIVKKMRWHQYFVEESNQMFSLWGSVHINNTIFDVGNRGKQVYACYVVGAGMTRIMAPEYWTPKTLDVIVMCGDRYYSQSKLEAENKSSMPEYKHITCWNKYLTNSFRIGEISFEAQVLSTITGTLYKSKESLWELLEQLFTEYHFAILKCENMCLGLYKFCGAYYACDVNSFGPPLFRYGQGSIYLIRATSFSKFMKILITSVGSAECSEFNLNPIEIMTVVDVEGENQSCSHDTKIIRTPKNKITKNHLHDEGGKKRTNKCCK